MHKIRPFSVSYIENPTQAELRDLAKKNTPAVFETEQGSLVKISRNKNRVAKFTYLIGDESTKSQTSIQIIDREKASRLIKLQEDYIRSKEKLIAIDGYLGLGKRAFGVEWLYTVEGANIAGMQQVLSFSRERVEGANYKNKSFQPVLRIIYTPNCFVDEMPGRQAVLVDLENYVTYIMGPDYFGESKKGALRMLNHLVYSQGGLVLHAGAKAVHVGNELMTMTIMGESGTGKTTTTFSKQGTLTQPIQDDMVCLWPNGEMSVTENGCFAKTEGLTATSEPAIYESSMDSRAWLENVYVDPFTHKIDFLKGVLSPAEVRAYRDAFAITGMNVENLDRYISGEVKAEEVVSEIGVPKDGWDFVVWTQNGRSIVPLAAIKDAANLDEISTVKTMGILNRDEGSDAAIPGLVRFNNPKQAAGYFMLGETSLTSAAGKERGKLRSPFTQPFYPGKHKVQATRFGELANTMPGVSLWMMNTGCIGGDAKDVKEGKALKVKISHSSAILEAMLKGNVVWKKDPDFGYEVVDVEHPSNKDLLEKIPAEILQPKLFFQRTGRMAEYDKWVLQMKKERREFLEKHSVDADIIAATI